jgi:hypothetical protein
MTGVFHLRCAVAAGARFACLPWRVLGALDRAEQLANHSALRRKVSEFSCNATDPVLSRQGRPHCTRSSR